MMPGANRDAGAIDHRTDIVWVRIIEREGDDARLGRRRADDAQPFDRRQPPRRIDQQVAFVRGDRPDSDTIDVVERGAEPRARNHCRGYGPALSVPGGPYTLF